MVITYTPQKWNSRYFEECTLTSLGLVVKLEHNVDNACPHPTTLHNLMVFNLSGAHRLVVKYCDCQRRVPKHVQLLRARWFPAMIERPSTAFAFNILNFFHKLQNHSKCNPYDFYNAIIQRTDAVGLNPEIVCVLFSAPTSLAQQSPSSATTNLLSCIVSGFTSTSSSGVALCTTLPLSKDCSVEAWRLLALRVPNQEKIQFSSRTPNHMNNFLCRVIVILTHYCCCKMEKHSDSGYRCVLQG